MNSNLWEARELALSRGGLVDGLGKEDLGDVEDLLRGNFSRENTLDCKEQDLILRDVGRSVLFRYRRSLSPVSVVTDSAADSSADFCVGLDNHESLLKSVLRAAVSTPLTVKQTKPCYYQGMHDVAGVLLHNLNYDDIWATALLRRILQTHLRDASRENFSQLLWFLDTFLLPVIQHTDPTIYQTLLMSEVSLSNAVLPWLITWFTHDVHDDVVSSRLVDAFMASHPLLPFYFAVALLVHKSLRTEILQTELDPVSIHMTIQALPGLLRSDWLDQTYTEDNGVVIVQDVIDTAISIMGQVPPGKLLTLVDTDGPEASMSRRYMLEQAHSVSLLKAPPSWAISSTIRGQSTKFFPNCECYRSKLASGVDSIMDTVPLDWKTALCSHLVEPSAPTKTNKRRRISKRIARRLIALIYVVFVHDARMEDQVPCIPWPHGQVMVESLYDMVTSIGCLLWGIYQTSADSLSVFTWVTEPTLEEEISRNKKKTP